MIPKFDAAIPGQSLTDTPGNANWERPPQYTDPEEALQVIHDQLMRKSTLKEFGFLIKNGAYIEEIARTVLFAGFTEGKWSVDTAMIIYGAVMTMFIGIARNLGILDNNKVTLPRKSGVAENMYKKNKLLEKVRNMPAEQEVFSFGGLMSRPIGGVNA